MQFRRKTFQEDGEFWVSKRRVADFVNAPNSNLRLFKALVEVVEDVLKAQFSGGVLATPLCFPGVSSFRWFWQGTSWTDGGRSLQVGVDCAVNAAVWPRSTWREKRPFPRGALFRSLLKSPAGGDDD
jgi:hypothetical protein